MRMKWCKFLACLLGIILSLCSISFAQNTRINKITVIGTEFTSPELVRVNSGLAEDQLFSTLALQDAIRSIYALGSYDDAKILVSKGPYGFDIEIHVHELPRVGKIEFSGNKKIKEDKLIKVIGFGKNAFLSKSKIFNAINSVRSKYSSEGYAGVTVKYDAKKASPGYVDIEFKIDEVKTSRIISIEFEGNKIYTDRKLRSLMDSKQKSILRSGKFDKQKYDEDLLKIEDLYRNKGYITAEIIKDSIGRVADGINITIWIEEGEKFYYKGISFTGNEKFTDDELLSKVKLKKGDVFSQKKLENTIQDIYFAYTDDGYIHARVEPNRKISGDNVSLDVSIDEGPRARIRYLYIEGNNRTFENVIRREVILFPGQIFKRDLLFISQRNVYFLNFFEDVVPEFKVLPNGDVDLTLKVTEKPIGRFQIGAAYNARDKFVGSISIGYPNVLGRGWNTDVMFEFGKLINNLSLSFTEPWLFNTPTSSGFDIYNTTSEWEGNYTELRRGGAIRFGRKLFKPRYFSVYARYKLESVKYFNISDSYVSSPSYDIRAIDWPQSESSLMLTIERDSRDSRLFASKGSKNSISIENSGGFIGGQIDFQKFWFKSDWYFPLYKYLTFVAKGHLVLLTNIFGNSEKVPYGERFYPGGISFDGQIRGYNDRSVGPILHSEPVFDSLVIPDANGNLPLIKPSYDYRAGGRAALILTSELRVPVIKDQLYFSTFVDAGNAWMKPRQINVRELVTGAGFGVRFVVPMMGIIGLDFGWGFDREKPDWQIHFQIGQEF